MTNMSNLPKSPNGEACELCRHWQTQLAQKVRVDTRSGVVLPPLHVVNPNDARFVKNLLTSTCCEGPQWQAVSAEMWCGRFSPRVQR